MSNVIFLDVDGVLNSKFWDNEHQREISNGKYIDSEAVKLLGSLVKRTNAKIILHSGWRFWFDETMKPLRTEADFLANTMKEAGITIAGVTPDLTTEEIRKTKKFSLVKADEILLWLKDNPSANWVVLDDLELHNSEIEKHQVKTDAEVGLTTKDVEKAITIILDGIKKMEIVYYETIPDLDTYFELRRSVDWNNFCPEQVQKAINKSAFFILVKDEDKPIAMGRAVGDGMYYTIVDVVVRPEYQGKKVGSTIISKLLELIQKDAPEGARISVQLLAEKGKEEFYVKQGFKLCPHEFCGPALRKVIYT